LQDLVIFYKSQSPNIPVGESTIIYTETYKSLVSEKSEISNHLVKLNEKLYNKYKNTTTNCSNLIKYITEYYVEIIKKTKRNI